MLVSVSLVRACDNALNAFRSACWLAGGRYARCLPGERRSPNGGAPTARRENSAAAVRELAGSAGG
jgi:hypothetical protein